MSASPRPSTSRNRGSLQVGHPDGDRQRRNNAWRRLQLRLVAAGPRRTRPDARIADRAGRAGWAALSLAASAMSALAAGFEFIEQRTRVFGDGDSSPLNRDKLRVAYLRVGARLSRSLSDGARASSINWRRRAPQRPRHLQRHRARRDLAERLQPDALRRRPAGVRRARRAPTPASASAAVLSLYGAARYQYANKPLLNLEEYSIGNLTIGRGYDPGANSADRARGDADRAAHRRPGANAVRHGRRQVAAVRVLRPGPDHESRSQRDRDQADFGVLGGGSRGAVPGFAVLEAMYARPKTRRCWCPTRAARRTGS